MSLRINRYTLLNLSRFYQSGVTCFNFSKCSSQLVINNHQNTSYQRKLIKTQNPINIYKRSFALKLYSQFVPEAETISDNILEYIKHKNDVQSQLEVVPLSNVFDDESAIKQIQSVILHSLDAQPDEVIKLFTLYKSYDRLKIQDTFRGKQSSKLMGHRLQSAVLFMSLHQLQQFAITLRSNYHHNVQFFSQLAQFTFEECLARAETSESLADALKYFTVGLELFGNNISAKTGFSEFMHIFEKHILKATPSELSQVLYFLGLLKLNIKKNSVYKDLSMLAVKLLVPHFDELSFIDAGLVANGLFKLNLLTEFDISSSLSSILKNEIGSVSSSVTLNNLNSFALVSIIKYLRFTLHKDATLLQTVKSFLEHLNESSSNPQLVSHMVALFANANFYDRSLYSSLGDLFFKFLRSSDDVVRIKDISRFMWAISHAQHQCKIEDFNLVIDNLFKFSITGEIKNHASHVIDSTLALTTLNIFSDKLMMAVLHDDNLKIYKEKEKSRYLSRLLVLSEVQKIALPSLNLKLPPHSRTDVPQRKIRLEYEHRPCIQRISDASEWLAKECGVKIFRLQFLVPHINYCSLVLTGEKPKNADAATAIGKRVLENLDSLDDFHRAIDVDDRNTALNEGTRTNGLEKLKRNLLQMQGWDIKVLSMEDIENCGEDQQALAALLLDTISR